MKAFRKVTAPSLERNKVRVRDMLAKQKLERDAEKNASEGDEGDDASIGGNWARDVEMMDEEDDFGIGDTDSIIGDSASVCSYTSAEKPRLNIADKKKMKKRGMTNDQMRKLAARKALSSKGVSETSRALNASGMSMGLLEGLEMDGGAGSTFKDNKFFMSYGNEDEQQRMQEDLMQPQSGLRDLEMQSTCPVLPCPVLRPVCLLYSFSIFRSSLVLHATHRVSSPLRCDEARERLLRPAA